MTQQEILNLLDETTNNGLVNKTLFLEKLNEISERDEIINKLNPLYAPANHHLIDIFKELKFGRPSSSQKFLDRCIAEIEE